VNGQAKYIFEGPLQRLERVEEIWFGPANFAVRDIYVLTIAALPSLQPSNPQMPGGSSKGNRSCQDYTADRTLLSPVLLVQKSTDSWDGECKRYPLHADFADAGENMHTEKTAETKTITNG
jgi:hypothetical protein